MPSKLSAYLGAGRPVVAAVAAGSAAALCVHAAGAGPVVDPSDPEALADALQEIADLSLEEREALGANGLAYSQTVLSAAATLPLYERFAEQIAAARGN